MSFPVVGIIAEYNPFHNGHAWHISRIREQCPGAAVLCVMSGHVTQRGTFAICRKQIRAAMAVSAGADLVLELPAAYACASAERFARGGVALLLSSGIVTHLSFGCETGRLEPLAHAAAVLDDPAFLVAQAEALRHGLSYPTARQQALKTLAPEVSDVLNKPNDLLGVEYLRALRHFNADITPLAIPRQGAAHDAQMPDGRFAPASFVRTLLLSGQSARSYLPDGTQALWEDERNTGRAPVSMEACEQAMLATLRRMEPTDWATLPDVSEGLENRLSRAAQRAVSLEEFYRLVKTKRYTHARIRRITLRAYLNLSDVGPEPPPYLRVLAAGETGLSLLQMMKGRATLPLLTKPASAKRMGKTVADCFAHEVRVTDLFTLCYPDLTQRTGGHEWTDGPVIL